MEWVLQREVCWDFRILTQAIYKLPYRIGLSLASQLGSAKSRPQLSWAWWAYDSVEQRWLAFLAVGWCFNGGQDWQMGFVGCWVKGLWLTGNLLVAWSIGAGEQMAVWRLDRRCGGAGQWNWKLSVWWGCCRWWRLMAALTSYGSELWFDGMRNIGTEWIFFFKYFSGSWLRWGFKQIDVCFDTKTDVGQPKQN